MTALPALVMPAAGAGSRFAEAGFTVPKPLIDLAGRPFFWWAAESVLNATPVREIVFVVLARHVERFGIASAIRLRYPDAEVVVLPSPSAGAAETAAAGIAALATDGPVIVNDCDHAFRAPGLAGAASALGSHDGALVGFRSLNPAYSYAAIGAGGRVTATAEKRPIGPFALAGCYLFGSRRAFSDALAVYRLVCPYAELYLSGLYNPLIAAGGRVRFSELAAHVPFGTPAELADVTPAALQELRMRSGVRSDLRPAA